MSFSKATDLLKLAEMARGRMTGVTLEEIQHTFSCSRRTAQRMTQALCETYPEAEFHDDYGDDSKRRWRIPTSRPLKTGDLSEEDLTALELAARLMRNTNPSQARQIESLKDRLFAAMEGATKRRVSVESSDMSEAMELVARPGPVPLIAAGIEETIKEAIKACQPLEILYRSGFEKNPRLRRLEAHGLLLGGRHYLVAKETGQERMKQYRLDRILEARLKDGFFERDPNFSLEAFASHAFGTYHGRDEFGEVVWKFTPSAAQEALAFRFHSSQSEEWLEDGSLVIRFKAAGWLEMCWYLYQWGDQVEVLAPQKLAQMVKRHRRTDFPALP